ncbi:MAG: hypothetical protein J6A52_03005 [Bacilli bacterium]|nr:hypothetical protein [Bacilli bacterium]
MYTDDEERRGLPIKTFLISLIIIIILVLLLIWLLPMPNMKGINNRIFNANIQEMKDAAIPYFTTDKLPQKVGDKITLTLKEMIELKLLLPFTDKNGDACDVEKSYVTLTKKEDSYEMKVNLKCNEEEDYILVTLGCYSYCTSAICEPETKEPEKEEEKKPEPVKPVVTGPSCVLYVSNGTLGNNGWYKSNAVVKFKTKTTTTKGATITSYGIGTGSVNYNKNSSFTVTNDGKTTVYGYVKDSNGKTATCSIVVKKDTVKPTCKLTVLSGTKGNDGSYVSDVVIGFASKTDAASGINAYGLTNASSANYNNKTKYTVATNGTHKIYGYVKDAAGHTSTCDITVKRNAKDTNSKPSCTLKVTSGTLGNNGWYVGDVNIAFATKTTTNGATISSFGLGTSENYSGSNTYTVTKDGTTTVYGYVKDSNGHTATCSIAIKRDVIKPSCSLKVTKGTFNSAGYYTSDITIGFNSKVDSNSGIANFGIGKEETYSGNDSYTIKTVGKHTVYGYIKDKAGNTAKCSITVEKRNALEYQYKKDIAAQYSNWSNWATYTYNPNSKPSFGKYNLIEIEDLGKSTVVDYYQYSRGDAIKQNKVVKVGTATQTYCKEYSYYRTTTTTATTTTTYAVKTGEGWKFVGQVVTTGVPTDTLSVKYEFVGLDWSNCGTECTRAPKKIWNKYTRTVYKVPTSNTVYDTKTGVTVTCNATATKQVELFDTISIIVGYEEIKTPVYKDVYKYRERRRTLVSEAYTDYKWSTYNNQTLLNQGYTMTGNTRIAE